MAPEIERSSGAAVIDLRRTEQLHLALLLALCLALWMPLVARPALAQGPANPADLRIQQLSVQVMPEFDDPRVLVIVQGRVDATSFPVTVTFRLPNNAQINQMATVNMATAGTTTAAYQTQPDPADARWQLVSYSLDGAHFFYEYYYDPIVGSTDKEFTYTLSSYHAVEEASIEIQQPAAADDFRTVPAAASTRLDENLRLYYHRLEVGALDAGQEVSIGVSYHKSDPDPSLTWEQVMALQEGKRPPEAAAAAGGSEFPIPLEIAVFLGGALLVLAGAFVGYRLRLSDAAADRVPGQEEEPGPFCRMCGAALKAEAGYCHRCGAMVLQATNTLEQATASPRPDRARR
jgi:hypothetical protein